MQLAELADNSLEAGEVVNACCLLVGVRFRDDATLKTSIGFFGDVCLYEIDITSSLTQGGGGSN